MFGDLIRIYTKQCCSLEQTDEYIIETILSIRLEIVTVTRKSTVTVLMINLMIIRIKSINDS